MLIVKDFSKLKKYGFRPTSEEKNIWTKTIEPRDANSNRGVYQLVVNPLSDECCENEVLLYVYADTSDFYGRTEVDVLLDYEAIFDLLMAGVIVYVPREVVAHGKTGTDG